VNLQKEFQELKKEKEEDLIDILPKTMGSSTSREARVDKSVACSLSINCTSPRISNFLYPTPME